MHVLYNRLEWIKANMTELDVFLKKDGCMSIVWRKIFQKQYENNDAPYNVNRFDYRSSKLDRIRQAVSSIVKHYLN